ncbi:MAG: hypothetical protein IJ766_05340 [Clostridia bacterium]|nr:hypothetical protein [Clostridia bacterium]
MGRGTRVTAGLLLICMMLLATAGCGRQAPVGMLRDAIMNPDEVVAEIRDGLAAHAQTVTLHFVYEKELPDELPSLAAAWVEAAFAETDDPAQGDYLRYQTGGYDIRTTCEPTAGGYDYTAVITPKYYCYLWQETAASEKFDAVMASFGFDDATSDYEKIRTIYAYLCENVIYDKVHKKNPHYYLRSTLYAALVMRTATCQGYSVTLYRMLRAAGVPARIIIGNAGGEYHAWNIVALDGQYYYLDATWDAGQETFAYFLRGADHFSDHIPADSFLSDAFFQTYPVAREDYAQPLS